MDADTAQSDPTSPATESQRSGEPTPDRVTISLIPKAANELRALQAETKMSRSDLINRAVNLYSFVTRQIDSGAELAIHFPGTGETRIVHVI